MSLCDCAFGPRCESTHNCEDETATMGIRDPRTGTIRARADWSIFVWHERTIKRFRDFNAIAFFCDSCLQHFRTITARRLPGIDPPDGASEFWRPSLTEHIRLSTLEMNRMDEKRELEERGSRWTDNDVPLTRREKRLTAAQWQQVLHVRRVLRSGC